MGVVEEIRDDLGALYDDGYYASDREQTFGYSDYALTAEHAVAWAAEAIRLLVEPGRILDLGSVDGHLLRKLPEFEPFGVEVNSAMADLSRAAGVEVITDDIFDPQLVERFRGSFDVVSSIAVFEHVKDIKRAIEISIELLEDGGVLLFELPLVGTTGDDSVWYRTSLEHVWYPTERAIEHLFRTLGLPLVGREVKIVDFGSTYVGLVARGNDRAIVERRFRQLIGDAPPENDDEARFRVLFDLVHAGRSNAETLALLPTLTPSDLNPLLISRLGTLWGSRETKLEVASQVLEQEKSALARLAEEDTLRHERAMSSLRSERDRLVADVEVQRRTTAAAQSERDRLVADLEGERANVAAAKAEAARARVEATAMEIRTHELSAHLSAIERSRAYRVGLAARRVKLAADDVVRFGGRVGRVIERRRRHGRRVREQLHDRPVVSVLMPVYNKGRKALDSVASVRRQTLTAWELIVWNDGSTDAETLEALVELDGSVGVTVVHAENAGVIAARNAAFTRSRGEFVCFLDSDDLLEPTYFEKAVLLLDEHPDVAIAYPWTRCFGDAAFEWRVPDLDPALIARENGVPVAAVMRREVMDATGGFNPVMKENLEDWELWAHAAALGFRGRVIPEHLFLYRYSNVEGRDAGTRHLYDDLHYRINQLHPGLLNAPKRPPDTAWCDAVSRIDRTSFFLPKGTGRPIVFFVPWLTRGGGGERFVSDVVTNLVADGRTVVVVVTLGCPEGMTDATEEMFKLTPYVYDLTRFLRPETWLAFCRSLVWRLGEPILVNVGSTWLYENLGEMRRAGRGRVTIVDQLFNEIGHVANSVAAGRNIDLTLTTYLGLERVLVDDHRVPSRVVTVPIGIETTNGNARIRSPRERPIIGWIGRLSVEKRPEWFAQLAAELGELATFRLAGEGPRAAEVRRVAGHVPRLELLGFVDDARDFMAECDLLVVTSEIEGIPLVAMEAISLGTPVIATSVGGLPDLIEPGINGYLVSPEGPEELVACVRALLERPEELARLQAAVAAAGLAERFTTPAMMSRLRELLV